MAAGLCIVQALSMKAKFIQSEEEIEEFSRSKQKQEQIEEVKKRKAVEKEQRDNKTRQLMNLVYSEIEKPI